MMGNQQASSISSPSSSFAEENWPWIWAIENPEYLDWKVGLKNDEIVAVAKAQADMPVLVTTDPRTQTEIYLCGARYAWDVELLNSRGITHVLNVAGTIAEGDYSASNIIYKKIEAEDEEGYPMLQKHLQECLDFIQSTPKSKILVHCVAGLNRSGVIVAAHNLLVMQRNVLEVVADLRKKRGNMALCNQSFIAQLVTLGRTHNLLGPAPGEPNCRVQESAPVFSSTKHARYEDEDGRDIKNLF